MCDANVIAWIDQHLTLQEVQGNRILDVGSRDVNGSVRPALLVKGAAEYVGVDLQAGPGVDVVCDAARIVERFGAESFDLVVSTCALEHMEDILGAVSNIKRICRPEGLILLAVPFVWPRHDYPGDYWRFSMRQLCALFADCTILQVAEQRPRPKRATVYAKFRRPSNFVEKPGPLPSPVR